MMWDLVHWDECAIELDWVVVEVGNRSVLWRLTKDGDDNAIIYVDQALMSVLKVQRERQQLWKEKLGALWVEQGLVFARDGYRIRQDGIPPGGPQDAGQVSARWRTTRARLDLPERIHDWRHSKVTNDLDAGENPVEVSANVRHHSPGYTMAQYGKRRVEGPASSRPGRLSALDWEGSRDAPDPRIAWLIASTADAGAWLHARAGDSGKMKHRSGLTRAALGGGGGRLGVVNSRRYLGQAAMEAAVLPSRAAYLIAVGSEAGFRIAVMQASSRWGGMTEPIVEASASGLSGQHEEAVRIAGVEALVNVDADPLAAEQIAENLTLPVIALADMQKDAVVFTCSPDEVREVTDPSYPPIAASSDGPLWQLAAVGGVDPGRREHARVSERQDEFGRYQLRSDTRIQGTVDQFGEYQSTTPGHTPLVLWVAEEDGLADSLDFWNTRALRPVDTIDMPMLLLPGANEVRHWLDFPKQVAYLLASRPGQFAPDVALVSRSASPGQLRELASVLGLDATIEELRAGVRIPAPPARTAPFTFRTDLDPWEWVTLERHYGVPTSFDVQVFADGPSTLRFVQPVRFNGHAGAIVRFWGEPLLGLPARPSIARLVHPDAEWRDGKLQLAFLPISHQLAVQMTFPLLPQATEQLLDDVTATHQLSSAGRLGTALTDRADTSALLGPGIYEAAIALTTPRSKELMKRLQELRADGNPDADLAELAATWGGRSERRYLPAEKLPNVGADDRAAALERLCTLGWAERGLESTCPSCASRSFVPLNQTSGSPRCPGCGAVSAYQSGSVPAAVHYRLDSFTDRASDNGLLPHLLVIAELRRRKSRSHFLPGTDVTFSDGRQEEVDIFGIWDGKVLSGEVKTSASEFDEAQLQRDVALSRRLGADVHLLASVTPVGQEVRDTARELCEAAGLELEVLDQAALRPPARRAAPATAADGLGWLRTATADLASLIEKGKPINRGQVAKILKIASGGGSPVPGHIQALAWALSEYEDGTAELLRGFLDALDTAIREYDGAEQKE